MKNRLCDFRNSHVAWGGPHCEGSLWEEKNYYLDGRSRFVCSRHYRLNRRLLLRKHEFIEVEVAAPEPRPIAHAVGCVCEACSAVREQDNDRRRRY